MLYSKWLLLLALAHPAFRCEKLHFQIANERSLILCCDQSQAPQCILCNPKPSHLPAQFQRLQLGGRWTTERTQTLNFIVREVRIPFENRKLPVPRVSPALLRSQEALSTLESSIFVGGNSRHSPVFLPSPIYLLRLGHLPRAERRDKHAGEN